MSAAPEFREWADERYGRAGVTELLLECQNKLELNVNILLWCAWCAEHFDESPELPIKKAMQITEDWSRNVTVALRSVRRALKTPPATANAAIVADLRKDVLAVELEAERIEQAMLADLAEATLRPVSNSAAALARAQDNFRRYAALAGATRKPEFSARRLDELSVRIFSHADRAKCLQA